MTTRTAWRAAVLAVALGVAGAGAAASEAGAGGQPHAGRTAPATHEEHVAGPALPASADWAKTMLAVVGAMFIAAAVAGPIYRSRMPEEIPPTHSHDEPPGTSHHHGPGGTVDREAPEDHHH